MPSEVMMPVYRVRRYRGQYLLWTRYGESKSTFGATVGAVNATNRHRERHPQPGAANGPVRDRVTLEVIMIPEDLWELIQEA